MLSLPLLFHDLLHSIERAISVLRHGIVYVKRKAGQLPYAQDPKAIAALSARSHHGLSAHGPGSAASAGAGAGAGGVESSGNADAAEAEAATTGGGVRLGRSLDADKVALRFAKYLCKSEPDMLELVHQVRTGTDGATFRLNVLHECLIQEKPEMVATYLALEHVLTHLGSVEWLRNAVVLRGLRSFAFICAYYDGIHAAMQRTDPEQELAPLVASTYRAAGRACIDGALRANAVGVDGGALKAAFAASIATAANGGSGGGGSGGAPSGAPGARGTAALLGALQVFYQLPSASALRQLPAECIAAAAAAAAPHDVLHSFADALPDAAPLALFKVLDLLSADNSRR